MIKQLFNWRAKRAGGRITVYAQDGAGVACRVVGVDVIEVTAAGVIATDHTGARYALSTGGAA